MRQLRESLLEELNSKNMLETIGTFNHLFRYSGTAEGEAAVSYLEEKLSEYGIPFEHCEYDGFFSLPVRAFAKVDGVEYPLVGDVYSAEAMLPRASTSIRGCRDKRKKRFPCPMNSASRWDTSV